MEIRTRASSAVIYPSHSRTWPLIMTRYKSSTKVPFFGNSGRRHDGVIDTAAFAEDGLGDSQGKRCRGHIMDSLGCQWKPAEKGTACAAGIV